MKEEAGGSEPVPTRAERVHSYFYESVNLSVLFLQRPTHIVITVLLDGHNQITCFSHSLGPGVQEQLQTTLVFPGVSVCLS